MSAAARKHARQLVWRSLVAAPILALFAFQAVEVQRSAGKRVGIVVTPAEQAGGRPFAVEAVQEGGPAEAAGVRAGDVIRQVGGRQIRDSTDYDRAARSFRRGEAVAFRIERSGESRAVEIVPGMSVNWLPLATHALVIALYLAMALLTVAKRPGSLPSNLLYWLFVLLAAEVSLPTMVSVVGAPELAVLSESFSYLIVGFQFGTELHLVSLIPRRPRWLERRPWWVPVYYAVGLTLGAVATLTHVAEDLFGLRLPVLTYERVVAFHENVWLMAWPVILVAILLLPIVRYPGSRGRLRAVLVLCGILPWMVYVYAVQILVWLGADVPLWIDKYWALSLVPYPVSIFVMLRIEDAARNRMLRNLIGEVQAAGSIEKISRLISDKLNRAFYTKCNYVFFRDSRESELTSAHTSGVDLEVDRIPNDYRILEIADRKRGTFAYPDDVREPLSAAEKEWLDCLQASLIVPLLDSESHMMGLLILGQKRSEEPYTPDDLGLLHALARQIAVAYENLALQLEVQERERVQRRVLDRLEGQKLAPVKECPLCGFCYESAEEKCPRDGAELTLTLPVERLIDGHYRLEQVLGRGGAAVVYLATDVRLDRGVAIKVLALSLIDDVVAPRRFEREARVAAQLLHPNIVTTHDFGKTRNGMPYIVMEHLEGHTLRRILKTEGCLDGLTAAEIFGQILDGLGAAHALGVVHRDLKPDNVFVVRGQLEGEQDVVKLLDFGLAKIQNPTPTRDDSFTSPGTIMGTISYMAPEQLQDREVDRRTDIFSVGVMAWETMTGRRPFEGRSPAQVLTAILQGAPEFPGRAEGRPVRQVLERCLSKDCGRRYGSAAELRRELIPALAACPRLGMVKSAA